MESALYGPRGFYRTRGGPAAHFRTSVHASPLFATAIARLLREIDEALGRPAEITLVDVGAGRGELLESVLGLLDGDPLAGRLRSVAIELADRPDHLPSDIEWRNELPNGGSVTGLLIANEWLDNVPCDVVEATGDGWRCLEVATDGTERLGAAPTPEQQAWLDAWWPIDTIDSDASSDEDVPTAAARAEIGLARDAAWQRVVATLARGVAIAIDYAHTRTSRPLFGTLTGYAHGRQTAPIPDGSCDITAHVALDACAAAATARPTDTAASRVAWTLNSNQRTVLHSLGITGARPELSLASRDPRGYLRALSDASAATELTDAHGLGGFGWLVQGVSTPVPPSLARLTQPAAGPPHT